MALSFPVSQNVTISERREYYIDYLLCSGVSEGLLDGVHAFASPLFSQSQSVIGFFDGYIDNYGSIEGVGRFMFMPFMKLWRATSTRQGRESASDPIRQWNVYTKFPDANSPTLPCSVSVGKLRVTLPFGTTFSRPVYQNAGGKNYYSTDDTDPVCDPMKYAYFVAVGELLLGSGFIDIDIKPDQPPPPPTGLTVCGVKTI